MGRFVEHRTVQNMDWLIPLSDGGLYRDTTAINHALLMDIRAELQKLNALLGSLSAVRPRKKRR